MKNDTRHTTDVISASLIMIGMLAGGALLHQAAISEAWIPPVYAEDEEDEEDEDEDEDEGEDEDDEKESKKSETKNIPTYEAVLVTKIITTLDPAFTTDRDGDSLVDGLDPHPTTHEREFFTDDDDDSVPNAFDMHIDEDDFAYYEEENDENGDGILDSYELMAER